MTGYLDSAARNLIGKDQPMHDNRYEVAEEYMKVMYKLFEASWADDAVIKDPKKGPYGSFSSPDRIRVSMQRMQKFHSMPASYDESIKCTLTIAHFQIEGNQP